MSGGRVLGWIDRRIDLLGIRRALLERKVPDRLTWWHTLGSATLVVFFVQIATGIVLATYYSPSPDHAYESVRFIETSVAGGAYVRGLHYWSASAMVVLVLAHIIRVFSVGAYKYPREINWLLGVALFMLVMGFSFTGYLLPWDQKAYWATQVGTSIPGTMPVIGGTVVTILRGGAELGAATLTRFYAFHVLWLPASLTALVLLHLALVIRQGIAARPGVLERSAPARTTDQAYPDFYDEAYAASKTRGKWFWPDIVSKDLIVATGVVMGILVLAAVFESPLEAPADPTDPSYMPRPEWYFLPLFQLLKVVPGSLEGFVAVGVPSLLVLVLVGLPFFDCRSARNLLHRPIALGSLLIILSGSGFLIGSALATVDPITPAEVGRPLTSMERAGRALYRSQHCAACHAIAGDGGLVAPDLTEVGRRHSLAWLHSFLEVPSRYSHLADAYAIRMPGFGPPTLTHQEIEELARYLMSLTGSQEPTEETELDDFFPSP